VGFVSTAPISIPSRSQNNSNRSVATSHAATPTTAVVSLGQGSLSSFAASNQDVVQERSAWVSRASRELEPGANGGASGSSHAVSMKTMVGDRRVDAAAWGLGASKRVNPSRGVEELSPVSYENDSMNLAFPSVVRLASSVPVDTTVAASAAHPAQRIQLELHNIGTENLTAAAAAAAPLSTRRSAIDKHIRALNPCLAYLGPVARNKIVRALELVAECASESSLLRAMSVVSMLADLRMDCDALLAGALKDASVSDDDIELNVGIDALQLLRENASVSRVVELTASMKDEAAAEAVAIRHLVLTSAADWRAVALELVDAVVRWRFYYSAPDAGEQPQARRFAERLLSLHAPLANQLGMWSLQSELEELAFECLHPSECAHLRMLVGERLEECAVLLEDTKRAVEVALRRSKEARSLVSSVRIKGRIKGLYSIFKKMQRSRKSFNEIYDMVALRIVLSPRVASSLGERDPEALERESCYHAMKVIHSVWKQFGDGQREKDFIANPKSNGYQSLHTTVLVGDDIPLEMQVRTTKMHRIAEFGRAAHWMYKECSYEQGAVVDEDEEEKVLPRDEFSFEGIDAVTLDEPSLGGGRVGGASPSGSCDAFSSSPAASSSGSPLESHFTENVESHVEYVMAANQALRKNHVVILSGGKLHYVKTGSTLLDFAMHRLKLGDDDLDRLTVNGERVPPSHELNMSDIVGLKRAGSGARAAAAAAAVSMSSSVPSSVSSFL